MNTEPIDIEIQLSSTFWDKPPKSKIFIDDSLIFDSEVKVPEVVKWSGSLAEGTHKIKIILENKDKYQTVVKDDKIVKDQLLNIDAVLFDDIEIGNLCHTLSKYYPNKSVYGETSPLLVKNCVNLGYNGVWELEFNTPVYIWLLENM